MPPAPFPDWLGAIMEVIMPQCGLPDPAYWPTSCNLNFYESASDAAGAHADDEQLFEGKLREITIISLSLGGTRDFSIHNLSLTPLASIPLASGDFIVMENWIQSLVKHALHKLPASSCEDPQRINLTWRWISAHQAGCPEFSSVEAGSPPQLPVDSPLPAIVLASDAIWEAHRA